jgi:predicted DNA-binding transcriptional regulator AlpA
VAKRFITYPELPDHGVPPYSRKHLLDLQRQGKFPLARQLSANRIGWAEDEIAAWVKNRPVARSLAPQPQTDPHDQPTTAGADQPPTKFRRGVPVLEPAE